MAEAERAAALLPDTALDDELYDLLLNRLEMLFHLIACIQVDVVFVEEGEEETAETETLADEHPVDKPPFEVLESKPAEPEPEAPKITMLELRKALAESRIDGADVNAILRDMGVDRLSALPESRYQELIDRAKGKS